MTVGSPPTGPARLPLGGRVGHFEITAKVGEGGMGEVWRATDTRLGREVAVKVLPADFADDAERHARFEREARVLASLNHANIATLHGLEHLDGQHVLVMELVEGEGLDERIARGPIPVDEAIPIALQIAVGLEAAHEAGIVHRDLKPANIRIRPDGTVKVLDFGLAKAWEAGSGASNPSMSPTMTGHATAAGVILGTAAYMSPEQARGRPVDRRTDIWAFGVVLHEMLTGRRLFDGETVTDVLAAVLTRELDLGSLPAETPAWLRDLLGRCFTRDPRRRLRDIGEARLTLEQPPATAPVTPAPARPTMRPAWRELAAWSAVAVLAGLSLVLWSAGPRVERPPRVLRAALPLPDGVIIELDGERAGMPALSPDGRRVAFGARNGAGPTRIWVHDLATSVSVPLAGTEGGFRPFWSPDGRTVGFFTWGRLSSIPVGGGPVTTLAPSRDGRGATWNAQGTIVFAPFASGPLYRVPEHGGPTTPVTGTVEGVGPGTHRFPQFLPDGEHFLYLDRPSPFGPGPQAGVTVGDLTAGATRRVLETASNAVYSDGFLVFVRDGALVAQPFDPERMELSGGASRLVEDLLANRRFSYGVFSASDAGVMVFQTGRQSDLSQLVWRDRTGRRLGDLGTPGVLSGFGGLALSPDGRRAAVSRVDPVSGDADLWLYDLARDTETRLARPGTDESDPVFSHDGDALYFATSAALTSKVVRRSLADGTEELLWEAETYRINGLESVAPDGDWILYDDRSLTSEADILLRPLDGAREPRDLIVSEADDRCAQVSPDGRWLAWTSDRSGRYEIYVVPFPQGGSPVQVTSDGGTQPRWHPSGRELFYKASDNALTAVPVHAESGTFAVGAPQRLFQIVEFYGWTYDVASDGDRFIVREPLEEHDVSPITVLTDWTSLVRR